MTAGGDNDLKGGGEAIVDTPYRSEMSEHEKKAVGRVFHALERVLLVVVLLMTLGAAITQVVDVVEARAITLGDILMMFLYTEVVGMVAVFYTGRAATFVYPIFIAITALARLVILQGKDMAPEKIVFEASAVLLLTIAAVVIVRVGRS